MVSILKSLFRFIFFFVAVLLVGQIRVDNSTVGARVQLALSNAVNWGQKELSKMKWFAGFSIPKDVTNWLQSPGRKPKTVSQNSDDVGREDIELEDEEHAIAESDRIKMKALLQ